MAAVTVERDVARPLERVWAVAVDVAALRLPLTSVETESGPPRLGWRFVGITGVGPLRFRDPMVVTRWEPPCPGSATAGYAVVKTGRVLGGWADVTLTATGPSQTTLRWRESVLLRPRLLGVAVARVTDLVVRLMFERAVDELLRRAGEAGGR